MILSKFKPSKPTALVEEAKEEKQHSLSKDSGVLKRQKPLKLRQKQYQIKKTKLNNEASTCPPKKQGTIFQFNSRMQILKKIRFLQKTIHSSTKFIFISSEMVKTIKFNYNECCFKWYFHNFGFMTRHICFANIFFHTIVSFQYIYDKCLGCNRTKKQSVVNCSVTRDIHLMQIIQYCLESAGTHNNTKQLFVVWNL